MRLLILGPLNTPHTEHLALGAAERGLEVFVGGDLWAGPPPAALPRHGIEVSVQAWPTARWLRELLDRVRPDVVHANWFTNAFVYLLYGATPMVAMAWGSDVYRAGRIQRLQNRFVARAAGMVMADSLDLLQQLRRLGARPDRSLVLNWGVDLRTFQPANGSRSAIRQRLGLPDGRIVLSPRSVRPVYNPRVVLDAFELLAARSDDVHLVLKHIHADAPELGRLRFPDRVHTIGYVPYEQMADYYRAADVCVSIASSDSSPRSVWEAMACGCPCVLSDLPWVHELIADGRDALIVPIEPEPVAEALARLLSGDQPAAAIVSNARTLVERHRDREAELDRLIDVYRRVALERHGTAAPVRGLHAVAAAGGEGAARAKRRLGRGTPPGSAA